MATENVKILNIKTGDSEKSVKALRQEIKDLRDAILNLDKGTEEYNQAVEQLQEDQRNLDEVMALTKKTATALEGSYDALTFQMAALKKEWRATTDEARRDELGKQILEINNQLKDLDASTGNFQRNVGDYKNQMAGAFQATAGAAGAVINPLKGMKNGLMAISKTPVIAILGLLANLIQKVIDGLKSSESNMMALTDAFGLFKGVGNIVTNIIQGLGGVLAKVGDWLGKMADKLGLVTEEMKAQQAITREQNQLILDNRKLNEENADAELRISKLKQQAVDKLNYSHKERIEFLKQALKEEEAIAQRNYEIAKREYEVLQEQSKLADNSAEENQALSDAYVKMVNAEKTYFDKSRELTTQLTEATNAYRAELAAAAKLQQEIADNNAKAMEEIKALGEENSAWLISLEEENAAALEIEQKWEDEFLAQQQAFDDELIEENNRRIEEEIAAEEAAAERKKMLQQSVLNATTSIMNSIADIMEANSDGSEKEERKIKGLRIASTTVQTLAGAAGAYAQAAATIPPPVGPIIGGVNAAAVLATGMAQIAKMKSTNVSASESAGGGSVNVTPPAPTMEIPQVNNITGVRQEEALNQGQRVYIVSSDLEANGRRVQIQEDETSF